MPDASSPIYSEYWEDPVIGELTVLFAEEMPDRISSLREAFDTGDWAALERLAHQLKGSSGGYGFHELVPYALELETAVAKQQPRDEIKRLFDELLAAVQAVRSGGPPPQTAAR